MTILLILIGSKVVYKDDYAVITGSMTLNAVETAGAYKSTSKNIDFPDGFNKDNCILISAGQNKLGLEDMGYGYGITDLNYNKSLGTLIGAEPFCVLLGSNTDTTKIKIYGFNSYNGERTLNYRIVLMKI